MARFDVNIVLIGDAASGKSCLLQRLLTNSFSADSEPTFGTEFGARRIAVALPDGSQRRVSVGVWDTSGFQRFHSTSARFLAGADAILACWDATSRHSWETLRAWVAEAREEEPSAQLFLAACKSDLVERPQRGQRACSSSAAPPAEGPPGAGAGSPGSPGQSLGISVEVEHWRPAGAGPQQLEQRQQQLEQQHRHHERDRMKHHGRRLHHIPPGLIPHHEQQQRQQQQQQQQQAAGKPAAERGREQGRAQPPAAPTTPMRAAEERPQSPAEAGGAGAPDAATPAAGAAAREAAWGVEQATAGRPAGGSLGQRIAAEHAAAAAAELVASLTGASLPSPFALAAAHEAQPAGPSPEPGSASVHSSGRVGGLSAASTPRSSVHTGAAEWEALSRRASSRHSGSERGSESPAGERRSTPSPQRRPPPAVPEAALAQYSASAGASMLWTSARTGEGVLELFSLIAQEVVRRRCVRQPAAQPARAPPLPVGPRRAATTGGAVPAPAMLPAMPPVRQQRCSSADGRSRQPRVAAAAGAAGAPGSGSGGSAARARSASPSPRGWQQLLHEYEIGEGQLAGGRARRPEEQSCRIA